jgi:hypothetical protein
LGEVAAFWVIVRYEFAVLQVFGWLCCGGSRWFAGDLATKGFSFEGGLLLPYGRSPGAWPEDGILAMSFTSAEDHSSACPRAVLR